MLLEETLDDWGVAHDVLIDENLDIIKLELDEKILLDNLFIIIFILIQISFKKCLA